MVNMSMFYSGDCYDFNADIKPLSCADGIDQDDDGLVDDEDPIVLQAIKKVQRPSKKKPLSSSMAMIITVMVWLQL